MDELFVQTENVSGYFTQQKTSFSLWFALIIPMSPYRVLESRLRKVWVVGLFLQIREAEHKMNSWDFAIGPWFKRFVEILGALSNKVVVRTVC